MVEALTEMRLLLQEHVEASNLKIWRLNAVGRASIGVPVKEMLANESGLVLVAEAEGKPVGFISGSFRKRDDLDPRIVGYINLLFVREGFRERGIGRSLVGKLCAFFRSNGVEDITLNYVHGNREAEVFWIGLGFEHRLHVANSSLGALEEKLGK